MEREGAARTSVSAERQQGGTGAGLAPFLGRFAEVGGWDDDWAGVRLRFRACLADEVPPRAYVGSVRAMVFRGEEVLVVDHGSVTGLTVGGRPEPGETLGEALVREVAEETGWRVAPGPVVGFFHARRQEGGAMPGADWHRPDPEFVDPVFTVEAVDFDEARLEDGLPPVRFVPIAEAAAVVPPLLRAFLERAVAVRGAGMASAPTPYADVNAVLRRFLDGAREILGGNFVGMYLYGSLAAGDFSPDRSDIDFVVVTEDEVPREQLAALVALHEGFSASDSPWALEIDGSYIPRAAMRRYDARTARHPHVERGVGRLRVEEFGAVWTIQHHVLREYGVALAGPPARELIEPVPPEELRAGVREEAVYGWGPIGDAREPAEEPALRRRGGQVYAALTMCRMLRTLETGEVVSKQEAGRWALETLDARWAPLIRRALAWKKTDPQDAIPGDAEETAALIRLTAERWRAA